MPRTMGANDQALFRAVVTTKTTLADGEGERTFVSHFGPYRTKGAATAAITYEQAERAWYARYGDVSEVTGHVEKASITWEPVP